MTGKGGMGRWVQKKARLACKQAAGLLCVVYIGLDSAGQDFGWLH